MVEFASCSCKVGRIIDKYELADLDTDIRELYLDEDASLRGLEAVINESIVEAALDGRGAGSEVDTSAIVADADRVLEYLQGAGESPARSRVQARVLTRLRQHELDVEELQGDLISYQTVRSHLNECLSIDTSREGSVTLDGARDTVEWARARAKGVIRRTVERLASAGKVTIGSDFEVVVSLRVECYECGDSPPLSVFLDSGGCECNE